MAPKRKSGAGKASPANKKAKTAPPKASGPPDMTGKETYCAEIGIDMENGGSQALFQWLCCSIIFGNRLSEKTTIRAAKGLINAGLTTPESVKDASWEEKIKALNSEGNVQRGPSMSERLGETAKLVTEKYGGDLAKLREAAKNKVAAEKKLIKEFKGIGETGLNIFCREAQLQWDELYPFADAASLKLAKEHGYPGKNAKELAAFVGDDKTKFVALLAALTKDDLRGTSIIDKAGDAGDAGDKTEKPESNATQAKPDETDASDKKTAEAEPKPDEKAENETEPKTDSADKSEAAEKRSDEKTEDKAEQAPTTANKDKNANGAQAEPEEKASAPKDEDASKSGEAPKDEEMKDAQPEKKTET